MRRFRERVGEREVKENKEKQWAGKEFALKELDEEGSLEKFDDAEVFLDEFEVENESQEVEEASSVQLMHKDKPKVQLRHKEVEKVPLVNEETTKENEIEVANRLVEQELNEFFNEDEEEYLEAYLIEKVGNIYGNDLYSIVGRETKEVVSAFLAHNDFVGVESYRRLTKKIEDIISASKEYRELNSSVAKELAQFYDETVSEDEIRAYLIDKVSLIYGRDLENFACVTPLEVVETYLEHNEFGGAESYIELTEVIEDSLIPVRFQLSDDAEIEKENV